MKKGLLVGPLIYQVKSANYTVVRSDIDSWIDGDASSGSITITLPTASSVGEGFPITVSKLDSSGNSVTVSRSSTDTINGSTSRVLSAQYSVSRLISNGSNEWKEVFSNPSSGLSGPGSTTDRSIVTWNGTSGSALYNNTGASINSGGDLSISGSIGPGSITVSSLPTASSHTGKFLYVSDVRWTGGVGGYCFSDGTNWRDPNGRTPTSSTTVGTFAWTVTAARTLTFPDLSGTLATLNNAQAFTAHQYSTPSVLTDAATISLNVALANNFTLTINGNRTLDAPTNVFAGAQFEVEIKKTSAGNTLSYNAAYKFPTGMDTTLGTGASDIAILSCKCFDGTNLRCTLSKSWT